ncbi:hypothetical protein A2704_03760 [Candidatus Kaiserbacteria bacterium RIFCSPHIGHO2_01_FULL_54_36b]|uniref:Transcription elongation factor GreA/GreB C-terminal domain-containing protein n=1 Tax=Candidatus Kaiserbacteria bacterium RIFCSPHIGHO2_01_FULL_54_36b TaxID=1798483 RepID=A0A1F6CQI5_9BACT|nr:MAG: hypothetical protein A2704_03760 [Candidatus Kaiserbacteria bacterium RIFCSPHIGHO2_01_FULL_54_36b]
MPERIYVSEAGLEALKERLKKEGEELAAIRAEKAHAYTATGDTWHDNPYFNRLEQDEKRKAGDTAELESLIASAQVFVPNRNTTRVQLGSIVHMNRYYKVSGEEEEVVWEIVGYGETDAPKRQVAYNAPLARTLMGLHVGETAQSETPKGPAEYEVVALYASWDDVPLQFKAP